MKACENNLDLFGYDDVDLDLVESAIVDDEKNPEAMKQIYELFKKELGGDTAIKLLSAFCHEFGGFPVYVPRGRRLESEIRKIKVWQEFTGNNVNELAKKYGLTVHHTYEILRVMRRRESEKRQHNLF